ncbi:MAG TPA: hypothetical protein VKB79_13230 [Bryobacteraceae bacterium]|nr:hypothetical protein [Bryobacteraceae bacterium]
MPSNFAASTGPLETLASTHGSRRALSTGIEQDAGYAEQANQCSGPLTLIHLFAYAFFGRRMIREIGRAPIAYPQDTPD